jgi:ribosome-binding protein aMBF1 (putative translation factor)
MKGEYAMDDFHRHLNRYLQDPEFRKEWELLQPEREYIMAIITARSEQHITQKELSRRSGIRQSNLSRIETGETSPTVATLQRILRPLGKTLRVVDLEQPRPGQNL